ncbi:hypothetical protein [Embleya sp. NPDC020630]|uniref:hypothetical protein n=1 Tax=Embleya sp. NPDC020630 TaxID=3363979 RepID=UPI0037A0698D
MIDDAVSAAGATPPALRALRDVHARYVRQTSCPSDVAILTFDVDPTTGSWGHPGLWVELAEDVRVIGDTLPVAYLTAFAAGVEEEWERRFSDVPLRAVVTVTLVKVHPVDSHEGSFRKAGHRAVEAVLGRLAQGV